MPRSWTIRQRFHTWLLERADDFVLRWIFRTAVTITIVALAVELASSQGWIAYLDPAAAPNEVTENQPALNLPRIVPSVLAPLLPERYKHLLLPQSEGAMAQTMTFELLGDGKLMATGTITTGISQAFATEVDRRGEYIKTVVLNSAGGSVTDALAMGRLIREKKFATEVEAEKYCVSSCPLVFAGGVVRRASATATIGVHQVAAVHSAASGPPRDEMSLAQNISARCQRYLSDMGVSPQVWVHAMETPHDKLFVLKQDELKSLNMVTTAPAASSNPVPAPTKTRS